MIEQTTVSNRSALVAYINDRFEPVGQSDATFAKVIFTDKKGGAVFLRLEPNAEKRNAHAITRRQRFELARERAMRLLQRYDENQPRDETGKWTSTGGAGGSAAEAKPAGGKPIAGFQAGVAARGKAVPGAINKWYEASPFKGNIKGAMAASHEAQGQLGTVGEQIAKETGVQFKNPGVKTKVDRILEKEQLRGGAERVTDLARGTFIVDSPQQANQVAEKLGKHFGVVEEDWRVTPVGYADKAMNLRFPNGLIGEMQIMDKSMAEAKHVGHDLYVKQRSLDPVKDKARYDALGKQMKDLYGKVLDNYSPAWKAALGIGGRRG